MNREQLHLIPVLSLQVIQLLLPLTELCLLLLILTVGDLLQCMDSLFQGLFSLHSFPKMSVGNDQSPEDLTRTYPTSVVVQKLVFIE